LTVDQNFREIYRLHLLGLRINKERNLMTQAINRASDIKNMVMNFKFKTLKPQDDKYNLEPKKMYSK
jgi:hypothetical protein